MGAIEIRHVTRVAVGVAAVLAQIALAFYYVGLPIFVVPSPRSSSSGSFGPLRW